MSYSTGCCPRVNDRLRRTSRVRAGEGRATLLKLACALALAWSAAAYADAPLPPPQRIEQWSPNRRFLAVADVQRNTVTVSRVDGQATSELWSISPWERSFHVSDDGAALVVCYAGLNLLPLDHEPGLTLLRFYRRGALVRKWTLRELVPERSRLQRTASHYHWGHCAGFDAQGAFRVSSVAGERRFDVRTGALLE